MNALLPKVQQPVSDARGYASREWYAFFRSLAGLDGASLQAEIAALADRVAALEDGESLTFNGAQSITVTNVDGVVTVSLAGDNDSPGGNWYYGTNTDGVRGFWPIADGVSGGYSITKAVDYGPYDFQGELDTPDELPYPVVADDAYLINGDLWVGADDGGDDGPGWDNLGPAPTTAVLSLVNDEESPGPTHYYGTNAAGDKGWHPVSDAVEAAAGELTKTVDADGVTTFGLADVSPEDGGTLQLTQFDAKGRRSHEGEATTDDLPEGATSLYFTAARVRDTLLTGLSLASSAVISATDSVLSAFGKLQAQVTALASSLSGYLPLSGGTMTGSIISDTGAVNFEMRTSGVDRGGMQGTSDSRNILWSAGGGIQLRPTARTTTSDQVQFSAGGDVLYSATIFRFLANTADGSDTSQIALCGGGLPSASRGGYVICRGNESAAQPGSVNIITGNGADMVFSGGTLRANSNNTYDFGTSSIGWKNIHIAGGYYHNGLQVVGARNTGWSAPTGTATKTAFNTATVTTAQLAERVKALTDALIAHGLIGT